MSIKRSADGVAPPYLDATNMGRGAKAIPLPSEYATVLDGKSPGHCKAGVNWPPKGPASTAANFHRRKE